MEMLAGKFLPGDTVVIDAAKAAFKIEKGHRKTESPDGKGKGKGKPKTKVVSARWWTNSRSPSTCRGSPVWLPSGAITEDHSCNDPHNAPIGPIRPVCTADAVFCFLDKIILHFPFFVLVLVIDLSLHALRPTTPLNSTPPPSAPQSPPPTTRTPRSRLAKAEMVATRESRPFRPLIAFWPYCSKLTEWKFSR